MFLPCNGAPTAASLDVSPSHTRILFAFSVLVAGCGGGGSDPDARPDADDPGPGYRCDLAECRGGFARTCDADPLTLSCTAYGASCADFQDVTTGDAFSWCDCGPIAEGQGLCLSGSDGVTCEAGLGLVAQCVPGTTCVESPGDPYGLACECDGVTDGVCPDAVCTNDPDCSQCTPDCTGKACGSNGCGGECGSCPFGQSCTAAGQCEAICVPDCTGKQCGPDGCGGSCGTCDGTCTSAGQCQGTCVPSCTGRVCGSDGCGGSCGSCESDLECGQNGQCGCGFFDVLEYTFRLDPNATWPSNFSFVALNVRHRNIDGTQELTDGEFLRLSPPESATWVYRVYGCRPNIEVKRDYALSGIGCQGTDTITDRTEIIIPVPNLADGDCTAPPL